MSGASPLQWVVAIALVGYIFSSVQPPPDLAAAVHSSAGTLVVIVISIAVFLNTNIVIGVLALVSGYELIRRSQDMAPVREGSTGGSGQPGEKTRVQNFDKYNHFPKTLEEEVVSNMAPLVRHAGPANVNYQPTLNPQHSAASVTYKGVI